MGILLRILFNAIGLLATTIVPGIVFTGSWVQLDRWAGRSSASST